ncbi:MAG: ABC transporter permease subunit [Bacteroidetes bacterium]|nr:MAG: ABC transporter permease subunit [Bacteroidota bacterium]
MLNLLYWELFKTFAKWRTYIGFIAVGVLIPVILWIMWIEGGDFIKYQLRSLQSEFLITGNLFNGWAIAQIIMNGLWVHVPALIALVAGDQLSGEATAGTFRLTLIRPVSRARFLNAKYLATLLYTFALVAVIGVMAVGLGLWIFGSGDLIAIDREGIVILSEADLPMHFLFAFALAMWSMFVVASLAFFISALVENAIGPIIITMTVIAVFYIITFLPVASVEGIKPWLFTTHMNVWQQALRDPYDWSAILESVVVLGAYDLAFWGATMALFLRKDILS